MSGSHYEQVLGYLRLVIRRGEVPADIRAAVTAFRARDVYQQLPETANEAAQAQHLPRFLLKLAVDALFFVAQGDLAQALATLTASLVLPLEPEPLEGELERFGAYLAKRLDEPELHARFTERYASYREHFAAAHALRGLGEVLLSSPPTSDAPEREATQPPVDTPLSPGRAMQPFAGSSAEQSAPTYIVLVRKLIDATSATFAFFTATLADITGEVADEAQPTPRYADLVLAFDDDASELLAQIEPLQLVIRIVFRDSPRFESFAVADGTLFDVECAVSERRLYLKLRVPTGWRAAQLPLEAIWSNVESVVLLSERD